MGTAEEISGKSESFPMPTSDFPFLMSFFALGFYFRIPSRHQSTWGEKKNGKETKSNLLNAQIKVQLLFFFPSQKYIYICSHLHYKTRFISVHWLGKSFTGFWWISWEILFQCLSEVTVEGKICLCHPPSGNFIGNLFIWKLVLSFQFSLLNSNYCVGRIALGTLQ